MEISKELQDAMNEQLNFELYSGYIYLSMAAYFESVNLPGMAHWMEVQHQEEFAHGIRFYRHIVERGGKVIMKAIQAPKTEWTSPLEAFDDAYGHELEVTRRIYKIGEIADSQGDRAAQSFLKWFYDEQVEEEANTMGIRDMLKTIGDAKNALFMLDAKLAARPAAPAPPAESTGP